MCVCAPHHCGGGHRPPKHDTSPPPKHTPVLPSSEVKCMVGRWGLPGASYPQKPAVGSQLPPLKSKAQGPAHRCCCCSNSCWEMGILARKENGFPFLYKWKQNPGDVATLPPKCDRLPLLQFPCHPFCLLVLGTAQQVLLVLTQGVFASPPFTCIKK